MKRRETGKVSLGVEFEMSANQHESAAEDDTWPFWCHQCIAGI